MKRVAVLMGGLSAEREVSLASGEACAKAIETLGLEAIRIDAGRDLAARLAAARPDAVFNALHGNLGEDGCVQGLLEVMGLPYTHSGVLASALAMDKPLAKTVFEAEGLRVARGSVCAWGDLKRAPPMEPPFVAKPAREGSSLGVKIVLDEGDDAWRFDNALADDRPMLVERYAPGRELTCAVLGDRPLAVTEIAPEEGFYDYRAKYTEGFARHLLPAPIPEAIAETVMDWALRAHRKLGCRGLSRADFRFDDRLGEEGLVLLEVNTQPGMTPLSLAPEQAEHVGVSFDRLVLSLLEDARCDL